MTKNLPASDFVAPPADLADVLQSIGLRCTLAIERLDGAPLTDKDRKNLPIILESYALARELQPTDDELADAVTTMVQEGRLSPLGAGGE